MGKGIFTDDSSTKCNVSAKVDVAGDGQMVQIGNFRNLLESLLELRNLQEDQKGVLRGAGKHTFLKWSLSLMTGMVSKILAELRTRFPCSRE